MSNITKIFDIINVERPPKTFDIDIIDMILILSSPKSVIATPVDQPRTPAVSFFSDEDSLMMEQTCKTRSKALFALVKGTPKAERKELLSGNKQTVDELFNQRRALERVASEAAAAFDAACYAYTERRGTC